MKPKLIHVAATPAFVSPGFDIPRLGAAILALTLSVLCLAGRFAEAEVAVDPAEMALVRQLRQRILSTAAKPADSAPLSYAETIPGTAVTFSMVAIPAGVFTLGSPTGEKGRQEDEGPQKRISLPAFWMGKYEVRWDEYELFMLAPDLTGPAEDETVDAVSHPTTPYTDMSFGMGVDGFPAICMTHHAAAKYCQWLSAKT
ncbi:MAG: formylglycine-generating enzyme family protein, partial [Acidobacteriota bacterium]